MAARSSSASGVWVSLRTDGVLDRPSVVSVLGRLALELLKALGGQLDQFAPALLFFANGQFVAEPSQLAFALGEEPHRLVDHLACVGVLTRGDQLLYLGLDLARKLNGPGRSSFPRA